MGAGSGTCNRAQLCPRREQGFVALGFMKRRRLPACMHACPWVPSEPLSRPRFFISGLSESIVFGRETNFVFTLFLYHLVFVSSNVSNAVSRGWNFPEMIFPIPNTSQLAFPLLLVLYRCLSCCSCHAHARMHCGGGGGGVSVMVYFTVQQHQTWFGSMTSSVFYADVVGA